MKFVPLSKVNSWQFKELNQFMGRGAQLKTVCINYLELAVEREAAEQLKGVPITIKELDGPVFNIGSGLVTEDSGLYKMIKLRIENNIVALKRQIIGDIESGCCQIEMDEQFKTDMQTVIKNGSRDDIRLASAIESFRLVGEKIGIACSKEMKAAVHTMAAKLNEKKQLGREDGLYADTWLSKYIEDKINKESMILSDNMKVLVMKTVSLCDKLEELGVKTVGEAKILIDGAIKRVCCIDHIGRKRVATKGEIERLPANMYVEYANIISLEKYYSLLVCELLITGESSILYKISSMDKREDMLEAIKGTGLQLSVKKDELVGNAVESNIKGIVTNISSFLEDINTTVEKLHNGLRDLAYPDEPLDKMVIACELSIKEEVDRIIKEKIRYKKGAKRNNIALNIAEQCKKKGEYLLTEKQMHIIRREYEMLIKQDEAGLTVEPEECLKVANELIDKYSDICNETVTSIAKFTIEKGICSYKQLEVLKKRLHEIKGYERMKEQSAYINAEDVVRDAGIGSADTTIGESIATVGAAPSAGNVPVPVIGIPNKDDFDVDALADELFS